MNGRAHRGARIALTLAAAAGAGWACQRLHVPLPWMLGPLALTAALGLAGAPVAGSDRLRNAGQWAIGVALGLYFTPAVLDLVLRLAPALVLGAAWALALGWVAQQWLRLALPDGPGADATACFSAAIGGASEMAVLAERHGAQVDRVAAAHSLRVLIVVASVPLALAAAGAQGVDPATATRLPFQPGGLALLALATAGGVLLLKRLRLPNPFVLGALGVTGAFTAAGLDLSGLPPGASSVAQCAIGVSLGCRFTPDFVRAAPRWLAAVALATLGMLVASAVFAAALAAAFGLQPASVVLATAPGGIAEMAITASVLHLGVPLVTAFQVLRYVAVLTLTAPLFRWQQARRGRRA